MAKAKTPEAKEANKAPLEVLPVREEKVLFEWEALERPYQQKDKEFWTTVLSVLGLVSLILFFVKEWFLIAALVALVFLYYVLTTVPPKKAKYRITTRGIYIDLSQRLDWEILRRFWTNERWGHQLLNVETWLNFPRVISLVFAKQDKNEVEKILKKYIPEEESSPNFLDKFSSWLSKKFPLEGK